MKNVISTVRTLLFAFALSLPLLSQADNHFVGPEKPKSFTMGMYQVLNSSKINLSIAKAATARMTILIKDSDGNLLHRETLAKGMEYYKRKFDLKEMGNGTYYFELITNGETITKKVTLSTTSNQQIALE
ncbi:hypothetical protein [Telluribacter sp.]|jgi:hypothetical protein|uniref:hypothetical protein n=1 Tax=Telluribacter sp. TaxID=1978767 RepID=UPI002E106CE2|nr:hypothetical protein [Telluribacter sp.]